MRMPHVQSEHFGVNAGVVAIVLAAVVLELIERAHLRWWKLHSRYDYALSSRLSNRRRHR